MSAFLPSSPTAEQQLLVDQLRHGPVARLLLLAIDGPPETAPQRARLSQALAREAARCARLRFGDQRRRSCPAAATRRCYSITATCSATRSTRAGSLPGMRERDRARACRRSPRRWAGAQGPAGTGSDRRDAAAGRAPGAGAAPDAGEGVWSSADGTRALILVQLQEDGTELDAQQAALESGAAAIRRRHARSSGVRRNSR